MNQFDNHILSLMNIMDYINSTQEFLTYEKISPKVLKEIRKRYKKEYKKLLNEDYEKMNYLTEDAKDEQ